MIRIRHTGIVTVNIKESLNFWEKYFNFRIKKDIIEEGVTLDKVLKFKNVKVRTLKLSDSYGNLIELLQFKNPISKSVRKIRANSVGITHISLTIKNLDKKYKKLKNKIKFNTKPMLSADKKVLMTYCRTPEGCFLELVQELK